MTQKSKPNLTSGRLLARNTIYSLLGQGIPLVIAIFSMPLLIRGLGTDRFGILTIAWMVISYFSLFDLGLGRALTQLVAEQLSVKEDKDVAELIWTASLLMIFLGGLGSICVAAISPWLVYSALKVPEDIQGETLNAFYLLATSIPIVTSSAGFVGVLSALQRFDLINLVKTPLSALMFLGPLLVLPFSKSLVATIGILIILRVFSWLMYLWMCMHSFSALRIKNVRIQQSQMSSLLKFGSWMTVSNIVGPLMVYLDRFLIGGMISVAAVAYYTTPYEVVTKLWLISGAIVGVLFPAFSSSFANNYSRTITLFKQGIRYIFLSLFPITCFIIFFAHESLEVWIGKEFSNNGTYVLQWLAIGIFVNSLSQVPFGLIQGVGRPDITAKLHIIELPIYLVFVWWAIHVYGISGAAFAWFVRVSLDTILLFSASQYILKEVKNFNVKISIYAFSLTLLSMALSHINRNNESMKIMFFLLVMIIFLFISWFSVASASDKAMVKRIVSRSSA
jgi:O-antigen/teichoic acid export membrane protein